MLGWFGAASESPAEWGDPILEERSLVATVLGTHAPPNTMVVSFEIGFLSASQAFPAYLYLLLDAKVLQSALESLEKGGGPSGAPIVSHFQGLGRRIGRRHGAWILHPLGAGPTICRPAGRYSVPSSC